MNVAEDMSTDTPILAMRAGTYRERPAHGPLSRLFCRVWSHRLPQEFERQIAVVPDGCCDLIWAGGQLMVIGPDRTAAFPALAPGETILGLRFRPGTALHWLDVPLRELVGRAVPLRELRDDVRAMEDRLSEANCPIVRRRLFDAWAAGEASLAAEPQNAMGMLFDELGSGVLRGSAAAQALGERTLRRRSHDHFGYGPKTLERILRLQRFLRMARQSASGNLATLALEAGYADQAHMTRDVKALTTFTPWEIRRQLCS